MPAMHRSQSSDQKNGMDLLVALAQCSCIQERLYKHLREDVKVTSSGMPTTCCTNIASIMLWCENTGAAWQLFFTARTWAKLPRFDSSVTLLLRRVVQSKTQWHSNVFKLLKLLQASSQASKIVLQFLQIKRLQLKLTNNLQNSYQISSQHQVPKTWVKQHPKTPKPTKTNENPSPSSSMHKLVPFGSKLVPTWFLWVL